MKKRIVSLILAFMMVLGVFPVNIFGIGMVEAVTDIASGTCGDNLTWTLDSEGTLTISGTGDMDRHPWSEYSSEIKSVVIEDGVTSICGSAFSQCASLASVTIPESVTSIGSYAFYSCSSLTGITIPENVTSSIGYCAFFGCGSLANVTIPDGVTSIGGYAFYGCTSLTDITIPESVTSIGNSAFLSCSSLTSITILDGVTSIGGYAFWGCTSLTDITIPESVTSIGDNAFSCCSSLTSITILDGVTSIGDSAFYCCESLAGITIPESVTSIGYSAFSRCTSLDDIVFLGDAPSMMAYTFENVVATATYPAENSTWTSDKLQNYSGTITWVAKTYGCEDLGHSYDEDITEPTCTEAGSTTYTCTVCGDSYDEVIPELGHNYEEEVIEPTCTEAGSTTYTCTACGDSYDEITSELGHDYEEVITEPTCTKAGYTTYTCTVCGDTYTADGVSETGHDEEGLVAVEPTCTTTGLTEGKKCTVCGTVTVPQESIPANGHTEIIENAKEETLTENGYTGDKVCSVCGEVLGYGEIIDNIPDEGIVDFGTCGDNLTWTLDDEFTLTISGTGDMTDYAPYYNVVNVPPWGAHKSDIKAVVIDDGVTSIGDFAFYMLKNITDIKIPFSVEKIGSQALSACSSLSEITIPQNVTYIGDLAFSGCGFSEISFLGDSPEEIGEYSDIFLFVTATATYPAGNATWTEDKLQNYGGTITWVAKKYTCPDLGKPHTEVVDKAVEPTCTEEGLTEGKHCSVCNAVIVQQMVIPSGGHTYSSWVTEQEASYTELGTERRTCIYCPQTETRQTSYVESIEVSSAIAYEGINGNLNFLGRWDETTQTYIEDSWFRYDYRPATIKVNYKDGTSRTFSGKEIGELTGHWISVSDNQSYENQWNVGVYYATATYMQASGDFMVVIEENPVTKLEFVKTPDKSTFYINEYIDLQGAVLRISYSDGSFEDLKFEYPTNKIDNESGYYNARFDKFIELVMSDYSFDEEGKYTVEITYADKSLTHEVNVISSNTENVFLTGNADNLIMTFEKSDGTYEEMNVLGYYSVRGGEIDDGAAFSAGYLYTDRGTFYVETYKYPDGSLRIEIKIGKDGQMLQVNETGNGEWCEWEKWQNVYDFMATLLFNEMPEGYSGNATSDNIEDLIKTSLNLNRRLYDREYGGKNIEYTYEDDFVVYKESDVRYCLELMYGLGDVDLTLYERFDAANGLVYFYGGYGGPSARLPFKCVKNDNHIEIVANMWENDYVRFWLNHDNQVIRSWVFDTSHKCDFTEEVTLPTCTEQGFSTFSCNLCGESFVDKYVNSVGHTEVIDKAIDATCSEAGKTEGKHCSVCNTILVAQTDVPANGHTEVVDKAVEATCTETGKTEGKHCNVCSEIIVVQTDVPAKGHTEVVDKAIEVTCTTSGRTQGKHCSVCNTVIIAQTEIPAKGHTETLINVKEATENEEGYSGDKVCSVCGKELEKGGVIPALGEPVLLGDVNGDDKINALDATQILRYANNKPSVIAGVEEGSALYNAADVNRDGKINALDATQILRFANNKPSVIKD